MALFRTQVLRLIFWYKPTSVFPNIVYSQDLTNLIVLIYINSRVVEISVAKLAKNVLKLTEGKKSEKKLIFFVVTKINT